jgi:hypothetical protein
MPGPISTNSMPCPETEGPYADFCPERILDMLSPTDNPIAMDWRHRCRDRLSNEMGEAPSPSMN